MLVLALSTYRCPRIPSCRGLHHFPSRPGRNALITIGIIIAGIIKRGEKIQKSIQDTFCSGSENEGDGGERRGEEGGDGGREGMGGDEREREREREGGAGVGW